MESSALLQLISEHLHPWKPLPKLSDVAVQTQIGFVYILVSAEDDKPWDKGDSNIILSLRNHMNPDAFDCFLRDLDFRMIQYVSIFVEPDYLDFSGRSKVAQVVFVTGVAIATVERIRGQNVFSLLIH